MLLDRFISNLPQFKQSFKLLLNIHYVIRDKIRTTFFSS